jgi:ring-1,2-phenylacetyl-CoA epoxidase subunit PaaA
LKGLTNDELRQVWMSATVPLCESLDLAVPAHYDDAAGSYVLDYPFPCEYDPEAKQWDFASGQIGWDKVFERWKRRGPMNVPYVEAVRRSHSPLRDMMAA